MTTETATRVPEREREPEPDRDQAHENGPDRPQYRVIPQADGGAWRGPTEAAWTTRILRGARPPKTSSDRPVEGSDPRR